MISTPCWMWRFSPKGYLEFKECRDENHWKRLRPHEWGMVRPRTVSKRLSMLAVLYRQENLFLTYREFHPRPERALEPENFQMIYKGTGDPIFYTPAILADIAQAFVLPVSALVKPRLQTLPRPFDGISNRRWDRMSTVQPIETYEEKPSPPRIRPKPGTSTFHYGRGEDATAIEVAQQEGSVFHFLHRTPRLYLLTYTLHDEVRGLAIIETSKKHAEERLLGLHPEAMLLECESAPALPGLAFDTHAPETIDDDDTEES